MYCKNCGNEHDENDKFCSKCGQNFTENNIEELNNSGEQNENTKNEGGCAKGCGVGCLSLFGLFIILTLFSSTNSVPYEQNISTQQSNAKFACQEAVKAQLKNPEGAEFPDITKHSFDNLGNMTYTVKSYVDATNSFGGVVRTYYSCKVKLINEDNQEVQGVCLLP